MATELNFERLIKAAWDVTARDFDENAFLEWRKRAVEYLTEILGPDHYYTQSFGNGVSLGEGKAVLSGIGVLSAAKEQVVNANCAVRRTIGV